MDNIKIQSLERFDEDGNHDMYFYIHDYILYYKWDNRNTSQESVYISRKVLDYKKVKLEHLIF